MLDKTRIEKNPGRRTLAKLMLNSFWGKLGQKHNLPQTVVVHDYDGLFKILNDKKLEVTGHQIVGEEFCIVTYKFKNDEDAKQGRQNLAIASFVTSQARAKLYRLVDQVESVRQDRVLYVGTDSCIFVERDGDPVIPLGDYLGELTDELDGGRCVKGVFCGPKNYGYEVVFPDGTSKTTIKVKGLTLNAQTLDMVNFPRMWEMVHEYWKGKCITAEVDQFQIVSNKYDHKVQSKWFKKMYQVTSEKRRLIDNGMTRPYGFVDM